MVRRALVNRRPWLLASLLFGIGFWFIDGGRMPGLYLIAWKGAAVGLLAVYAWWRTSPATSRLLPLALAICALGDMAMEIDTGAGAAIFLIAHLMMIALYALNRRTSLAPSQKTLASLLVIVVPLLGFLLPADRTHALIACGYMAVLGVMAAMAWTSRFPRYRTGLGALLFVGSDLLIVASLGPLADSALPQLAVWPLYYFGQLLIALGIVQTLRREDHLA